jgi:hypothetical protein
LGSAAGKLPIRLTQTEFSLMQFATRMGQVDYIVFNRWKMEWVAGFLEKKHRPSIDGKKHLKQVWVGPLPCEMVIAEVFETFQNWLPLDNF